MNGLDRFFVSRPVLSYLMAVVGPVIITVTRLNIQGWSTFSSPFVLYTLPVVLAATWGGIRPGVVASLLGLGLAQFFLVAPHSSLVISNADHAFAFTAFLLIWLFISVLCDGLRSYAVAIKTAAAERDESKARLDEVLDRITDFFYVVDEHFNIVHANRALAEVVAQDKEDIKGMSLWDLFAGNTDGKLRSEIHDAMHRSEPTFIESHSATTDSWYELRIFPSRADRQLAIFVQDVTDKKTVESQTQRALAAERAARSNAELSNRMKDEFVAVLSHELRTPLTAIIGWTEILLAKPESEARQAEGIKQIEKAAHHQAKMIEDLLDVSRIITGQLRMNPRVMNLTEVFKNAINEVAMSTGARDRIIVEAKESPIFIYGDAVRVKQIVSNLTTNALKFSPEVEPVTVALMQEDDHVVMTFSDRGEGIPAETLPFIFDRFRQANASLSRKHGGLGLGLAIVKQLVDVHQGTVVAESKGAGHGAVFTVKFPLTTEHDAIPDISSLPIPASLDGKRILIVEDDEGTRQMLSALLEGTGAKIEVAASAGDALEIAPVFEPDVIVSDIGMPEMDGYQFMRMLRNMDDDSLRHTPSIALTAFAKHEDREKAIDAGFNAHLSKPVSRDDLLRKIGKVLEI